MTVLFSDQVWPHTLDKVGVSVRYQDNKVQLIANVPVQEFITFEGVSLLDLNADGLVSLAQVKKHQAQLINFAQGKILLLDQDGQTPNLDKAQLIGLRLNLTEIMASSTKLEKLAYIKLTLDYAWAATPDTIDLRYNLLETIEPIHLQILDQTNKLLQTTDIDLENSTIRIKPRQYKQYGAITNVSNQVEVQSIWQTGVWHVLKGADHILLILALVLVVRKLKSLLLPLTSFTLCHSITLALIAQGFSHSIPAWVIEVAIAASILMILAYDLIGKNVKSLSIVTGGLGIIHGMGFAQALTATLGDLMSWANTLVKLTLAIEFTQLGIACLGLALIYLVNKLFPKHIERYYQVCTLLIALMASYWLFERITLVF